MQNSVKLNNRFTIDKDSRLPYYFQLKQYIIEEIKTGRWKPGQQIMPEIKICDIYKISRTVIRQTYQELVNEGYLIKRKAKGTFVAEPKINENLVQSLIGFFEDMTARGYKVKNDVLWQKKEQATQKIATNLNLELNEDVITIGRVRKINDEPLVLVRTYIPYKLCPKLLNEDLTSKSLYSYLEEKYNLKIGKGIRFIEAIVAKEEEAKLLNIKKGAPLLFIESISYLKNDKPLEYYVALHRADKFRLVTELKRIQARDMKSDSICSGVLFKGINKE